jgi:hypothetical protein
LASIETAEKRLHFRDLSVANNDEKTKNEILKRWKKREQKKLLSDSVPLHCEK